MLSTTSASYECTIECIPDRRSICASRITFIMLHSLLLLPEVSKICRYMDEHDSCTYHESKVIECKEILSVWSCMITCWTALEQTYDYIEREITIDIILSAYTKKEADSIVKKTTINICLSEFYPEYPYETDADCSLKSY